MADIKASEIAGELRKGERLYEVFRDASKVAAFFVDLEQKEAQLRKLLVSLEDERKKVDAEINAGIVAYDKQFKESKDRAAKIEASAKAEQDKAIVLVAKAREEASALVKAAKDEVTMIKQSLESLRAEERGAKIVLDGLRKAQEEMVKEMHSKRDALLKAFS